METNHGTDSGIAQALTAAEVGTGSIDELVPQVYPELRAIAHRYLASDRSNHTLSTTALIHEAYLRLVGSPGVGERGRAYFFAAAARSMRQVLVDYARRRDRLKRGGGARPVTLDAAAIAEATAEVEILDLDRALTELTTIAERAAAVVECRFFGGLTVEETALALQVTTRTVKRDWSFARAWLSKALSEGSTRP